MCGIYSKMWAISTPATESVRFLEMRDTKNVRYYPPPTESGRLLETADNFSATTPPPPVSCCAPPRLPAPDPPLIR